MANVYDANETMKMLGQQCSCELIGEGKAAEKDFMDVLNAYRQDPESSMFGMCVSMFSLGFIHGKRAERKRKALKKIKGI